MLCVFSVYLFAKLFEHPSYMYDSTQIPHTQFMPSFAGCTFGTVNSTSTFQNDLPIMIHSPDNNLRSSTLKRIFCYTVPFVLWLFRYCDNKV